MCRLILFIFLIFSHLDACANGLLEKLVSHVENNGVEKIDPDKQDQKDVQPRSFSKYLSFLEMHKNLEHSILPVLSEKELNLIKKYIEENDYLEAYEFAYMQAQEECFFVDSSLEKKCEELLDIYFTVNEVLHNTGGDDTDTVGEILGITLDGASITETVTAESDPNYELLVESQLTENRNMITTIKDDKSEKDADYYICEYKRVSSLSLDIPYMDELTISLEKALISKETTLAERKEIFCLLLDFYQRTENYERLIDFLYLNAPEGDNFCRENIEL